MEKYIQIGTTKVIELQSKIIHQVYASNSYVSNYDPSVMKLCRLCQVYDKIPHTFVYCIKVNVFWRDIQIWLGDVTGNQNLQISTSDIIFGILNRSCFNVNFCIIYANWFIHRHKSEEHISVDDFKSYLKGVLIVDKQIA